MHKIELSISSAMSLHVFSSSGSEDEIEEIDEDINEDDVADVILSTSDEDFEKLSPEDFEEALNGDENLGDDEEDDSTNEANEEEPDSNAEDDGSEQAKDEDDSDGNQPNEEEQEITDEARYQEAFNLLYGDPIKASGREVQLRNPEHAKNFIEMGIDYNKKMNSMKPHLRTLKTLEREGLLDAGKEERLNLLIEIEKGNKDALKRFIAESDMDPLDLADEEVIEEGREYRPQNHMMSEQEVEIEEALNSIEGTPSQQRTLDVMTKEFDAKSREVISDNPRYIVALNQDIGNGIFDEVMKDVQYKRDMNMVPSNISDIELYIQTVSELNSIPSTEPQTQQIRQENKQTSNSQENKMRKHKMSGNRSSRKPAKKEYDPIEVLSMDDNDFMKKFDGQLQ